MFIEIPIKSTQKLDISSPLVKYAKKNGHKDKIKELESVLSDIMSSRNICLTTKKYINEEIITAYIAYYGYANEIVKTFPVLDDKPIGLKVSWSDITNKSWGTTYNFVYEIANVLANVAALYTQQAFGYLSKQVTIETAGKAALAYEQAAKLYKHLHTEVYPSYAQVPMTSDMNESGLCGLQYLCHGYSQLAFCIKAKLMEMNPQAISALYFGCIELFKEAANFFTNSKNYPEYLARSKFMGDYCTICGYEALFHHYKNCFEQNMTGVGYCLGISNYCKQLLRELVTRYDKKIINLFEAQVLELDKKVKEDYSESLNMSRTKFELEEDAKTIACQSRVYHKALEKPDLPNYNLSIFNDLLPEHVKEGLKEYRKYVQDQLNVRLSKINAATSSLEGKRKDMKIKSTINASREEIPDEVLNEIETIRRNNQVSALHQQFERLETIVKEAGREIEDTNRSCNQFEARFGNANLDKVRTNMMNLQREYEMYAAKLADIRDRLEDLDKNSIYIVPAQELQQMLPPCNFSPDCLNAITNLQAISGEIDTLIKDRERKLEMIQAQSKNDTAVRNEYLSSQVVQSQNCFFNCFAPVNQTINELEISIQSQEALLSKLQAAVKNFQICCNDDKNIQARVEFYECIFATVEKVKIVETYISQGIAYFQNVFKRAQENSEELQIAVQQSQYQQSQVQQSHYMEVTPSQRQFQSQYQNYQRQYNAPEVVSESRCPTCRNPALKGEKCPYCSTHVL